MNASQITSEDDDFLIDGQVVYQVCIVGLIITTNPQPSNYNYQIDDSTGLLDVRIWIDNEPTVYVQQMNQEWAQGRYVRVIGNIKAFGPKRTLIASRLNLVEDPNEICYHHLECLHSHIKNTIIPDPPQVPPPVQHNVGHRGQTHLQPAARTNLMNQFQQQQQHHPPQQQQQKYNPSHQQQSHQQSHQQPLSHQSAQSHLQQEKRSGSIFNRIQNSVMNVMKVGHPQNGMSLKECAQRLKNMATEAEIRSTIEFLCNEGHLFSTIDDQHYAPTGS
jgi:replication factor A2